MPLLVQFGAGNIGRGFIGALFASAGWKVLFVDVDPQRIAALAQRHAYQVLEVTNDHRHARDIIGVDGVLASDRGSVVAAVAEADLLATAVGLAVLPTLAPVLAEGWRRRQRQRRGALDVLICENGAHAHEDLRAALLEQVSPAEGADMLASLGLVRTSVGRMIPPSTAGQDLLDIAVEPYACLPVERAAFTGSIPVLPGLDARADFDLVIDQKLYLHNLTHACLAYAGHHAGLVMIADCVAVPSLAHAARAAGDEAAVALAAEFGAGPAEQQRILKENRALVDSLFIRYGNRALLDPVQRVARDPFRKLSRDDRLVGSARLCMKHGLRPTAILHHIMLACTYQAAPDEPGAARWLALVTSSPLAALAAASGLSDKDPLMTLAALTHRRNQAAQAMRSAGIVLTAAEEDVLEIADFGLGRFDQFGLAIHIYVNTSRCCAKELVMVPGQICPEHRHPPIDADPGKEETFRVRAGQVSLFVPGPADQAMRENALGRLPADKRSTVTVYHRVDLKPGDQYTLNPNTPHWFVAGSAGAIVSEFSTRSRDEADVFTDHQIKRVPVPA